MSYWSFQHYCCVPVAVHQTVDYRTVVHNIVGNKVHVWLMDSCVVLNCSVCPWTTETVFWCHQLELELIQPPLRLHLRQPLQPHCSFDCDVILTSVDSYGCLCAFSHRVRLQSVACSLASDNRMADHPVPSGR